MKIVASTIMCLAVVLSLTILATAQRKKSAVSVKVMNDIFRQLASDSKAGGEIETGRPVKDYIDVEVVPLSKGKTTFLIAGNRPPFYGAHAPMYWVYEKTTAGYRQVDALGANYSVRALQLSHNGFRDLATTYISGAGTVLDSCKLIFNGSKYVSAGCKSGKLRK